MADISVELANDAFADALKSLKRENGEVGRYIAMIRDIDDQLCNWKKKNPRYSEHEDLRHFYEVMKQDQREVNDRLKEANDRLKEANDRLKEANDRLKEARAHHLKLTQPAHRVAPSDTCILELFREMIAIQRQQQGSLEEMKQALISLSHKISSNPSREGALGAFDAVKKMDQLNVVSGFVGTLGTQNYGCNRSSFEFKRDDILKKMFNLMNGREGRHRFLLLNFPAASGKTSLLLMFQGKYPQLNAHYISMMSENSPYDSLLRAGLNIKQGICEYNQVIYMLDDAL
jgi:hypothetical protein